jgi:endonuclease YncB( thermonuclease family)
LKSLLKLFLLAIIFNNCIALAANVEGKVIGIADGDTITILDNNKTQLKIRLAGIDAPEKNQPFGSVSKKSLSDLVFGKHVTIHYSKQDRYGRIVGKVILEGRDMCLEQIYRGMAWYYKKYKVN